MLPLKIATTVLLTCLGFSTAFAQVNDLPVRDGPPAQTTGKVPHIQLGAQPVPELTQSLLKKVQGFNGVILEETRIGFPGSVAFTLISDVKAAQSDAIIAGREFGHMHPDGSLHVSLDHATAQLAISQGWAGAHPWAKRREGWEGFVMIFSPRSEAELTVVLTLLEDSYRYITGLSPTG